MWGQKWCLVWAWVCWWVGEFVLVAAKMGRISAGSGSQQVKRRSRLSERATDFISRGLLDQQPLPPSLVSCAPPLSPVHIPSSLFSPWNRPERWSNFWDDAMVIFFSGGTIAFDGFSMVLLHLDHYHWMFFHKLTIVFGGFSMVFKNSKPMVRGFIRWYI